jgi:hypothetical protein
MRYDESALRRCRRKSNNTGADGKNREVFHPSVSYGGSKHVCTFWNDPVLMQRSYRVELDLTNKQKTLCMKACGLSVRPPLEAVQDEAGTMQLSQGV